MNCNLIRYVLQCGYPEFPTQGVGALLQAWECRRHSGKACRKAAIVLGRLHVAAEPRDMALPGLRLHPLAGNRKGTWSVIVSGNWRITFEFSGSDVKDVNYEDYH